MIRLVTGHDEAAAFSLAFALEEIGAPFELRALDLRNFAQWNQHRALSPDGRSVVLEIEGRAMDHPLLALLYLAETATDAELLPNNPAERYLVHAGSAQFERQIGGSLSYLGWLATTSPPDRQDYLARLVANPERPVLAGWSAVWRDAIPEDRRVDDAKSKIRLGVAQVAAQLGDSTWLAGGIFSVADITAFALLRRVADLVPDVADLSDWSALASWYARIAERPAALRARRRFVEAGLDLTFCPPVFL